MYFSRVAWAVFNYGVDVAVFIFLQRSPVVSVLDVYFLNKYSSALELNPTAVVDVHSLFVGHSSENLLEKSGAI